MLGREGIGHSPCPVGASILLEETTVGEAILWVLRNTKRWHPLSQ